MNGPGASSATESILRRTVTLESPIELHLDAMREDGEPIPAPTSRVAYVNVPHAA